MRLIQYGIKVFKYQSPNAHYISVLENTHMYHQLLQ